jgi:hypothetical protein
VQLRECLDLLHWSLDVTLPHPGPGHHFMLLLVLSEGDAVPPQLVPVPGICGYSTLFLMMRFDSRYRHLRLDGHLLLSPGLQVSFTGSAMLGLGEGKLKWQHLLVLGQLEGGVGGEAGIEEGGLSGQDGNHTCSQQWLDVAWAENTETLATVC